jgi:RNA polymerase sigma-70 factor (ECF subfamily)
VGPPPRIPRFTRKGRVSSYLPLACCRASAEDITQEAFTRAFRAIHNLREAKAVKGWLMTITRNESTRWRNKQQPILVGEILASGELVDEHSHQASENCDWVSQGLAELSDDYRTVVLMFYFEQLSYTEIADRLEIPIGTVMSRLSRGRMHLKDALKRLAEPNSGRPNADGNSGSDATWASSRAGRGDVENMEEQSGQ